MGKSSYLEGLGQFLGFRLLPKATTFKNEYQQGKGILVGLREGFLIAIGLVSAGHSHSIAVMVRYRRGSPKEAMEAALKDSPTFKTFTARKPLKVSDDNLVAYWPYAFKKPAHEQVLAFVDEIVSRLRGLALPYTGKCEDCASADENEVILVDSIPGYHCAACQSKFSAEKERAAEEYRNRRANYLLGIPVGILCAAIAGTAWGVFISWVEAGSKTWTPKLHMIVAFAFGGAIAWPMFKTIGKVTRVGQGVAILLTVLGKFWGDSLFYTFDFLLRQHSHISINPLLWMPHDYQIFVAFLKLVIRRFWVFKLYDMGKLVLLGDLAFAGCLPWLPWGKLPKFIPVFERVGKIEETANARAASAANLATR